MKLVLMGDFHYSRMESGTEEMHKVSEEAYSVMIDTFLKMDADFHISIGDLTHEGHPEEFDYLFSRIRTSDRHFIHVLGNHDTLSIPKTDILTMTGQQRYQAIDTEEAKLIFLDTTKEMNRADWGGEIDPDQLEWLQSQLETSGDKPVFVFAHHPIYGTTARSTIDKLSIHPKFGNILDKKKGSGFYFCGHNHVNSIVWQDGWHYIQTAACLDIPAFRVVELKDGKVTIKLIPIDDVALSDHIAHFNTVIPGFEPMEKANGEEADRNLAVDIMESVK
ncbi:metallophosphoesterase family protein [Ectobacillus sp. sgz5001026]|uniref:metallophosphoesterase family protein n=1 Tax=Ectobacillus sp. sgz5001026 TaxID=3242473 RepID=UPI0036D2AFB9